MAVAMVKNASNQRTDPTLKDQLFEIYNFGLQAQAQDSRHACMQRFTW